MSNRLPPEQQSLRHGQKIEGSGGELYRIDEVAGRGAFGITYKAVCLSAGKTGGMYEGEKVAIKECFNVRTMSRCRSGFVELTDEARGSRIRRSFEAEAKMIARCQKQLPSKERGDIRTGFVPIYQAAKYVSLRAVGGENAYTGRSLFYYVMPYIDGETLESYIGELEIGEIVWLLYRLLVVLRRFHAMRDTETGKRLLHRDIKPSNIMVTRDGYPVLVDYGGTVANVRTPKYAAPEQEITDAGPLSDIYSLAMSFYEILREGVLPAKPIGMMRRSYEPLAINEELRQKLSEYERLHGFGEGWGDRFLKAIDRGLMPNPRDRHNEAEWLGKVFSRAPEREWRRKRVAGKSSGGGWKSVIATSERPQGKSVQDDDEYTLAEEEIRLEGVDSTYEREEIRVD